MFSVANWLLNYHKTARNFLQIWWPLKINELAFFKRGSNDLVQTF